MKELDIDAVVENLNIVTDFVDEQLEGTDCSMKIHWHLYGQENYG